MDPADLFYVRTREITEGRTNAFWSHIGIFSSVQQARDGIARYEEMFPETRRFSWTIIMFKLNTIYDFAPRGEGFSSNCTEEDKQLLLGLSKADQPNELWREFMGPQKPYTWHGIEIPSHCHCGLCGNTGIVNTQRITYIGARLAVGVRRYCICPNGRAMLAQNGGKQLTEGE